MPGIGTKLEQRLPAMLAVALVVAMGAFLWATHDRLTRVLIRSGEDRVRVVGRELATNVARSAQATGDRLLRVAQDPQVHALLETRGRAEFALEALTRTPNDPMRRGIAILSPRGDVVAASGPPVDTRAAMQYAGGLGAVSFGPLQLEGDTVYYVVVAKVTRGNPDSAQRSLLGYVVSRRATTTSAASTGLLSQLVGNTAEFLTGNTDGSLWLRGNTPVTGVPSPTDTSPAQYREADGRTRIGAAFHIPPTPWALWVSVDRAQVTAAARSLLVPLGLVALLVVGIATGGVFLLGQAIAVRTAERERALAELKQAQEDLVRKERLATLGQLAGGVGHELRNPLGVMTNAVYVIEASVPEAPSLVKEYLGILRSQIALSARIVSDLLDFARVKTPQREPVDVAALIESQIARLGPLTNVAVRRDLPGDLPRAWADPVQVGQVVLNLLTNAVQAMESGGTLSVRACRNNGSVVAEVHDTGPGIPAEQLGRIFEPLYTTKARGIGLGLAVSRSLASANDGEIQVQSTVGAGSTFSLRLPIASGAAA